ncbi:MAG TPA: ferrous iron transporter B, partial [Ruminococcus sp.]|nr:ferrous iron transporter B [Ruminococcus sp.]
AKESVVSSLSVLFGNTSEITSVLTSADAVALLVFCLLYTPCVASISSVKRELGGKWAFGIVIEQCAIAWIFAFITRAAAILII